MENNVCKFCGQVLLPGDKCNCVEAQLQEQKEIAFNNAVDEIKECAAGWHQTIEGKHYCKECFTEVKNK